MNAVLATLIVLAVFVLGWFFTAKKLATKHWLIRHLAGSVAGFVAFFVAMIVVVASGLVDTASDESAKVEAETPSAEVVAQPVQVQTPAAPVVTPVKEEAAEEIVEVQEVQEAQEKEPEEENAFSPEQQAILDEFRPRMASLAKSGAAMESLRHSDDLGKLAQCGDLMRKNQAELRQVRDEYSAAMKGLALHHRFHPNFEPLFIAEANLTRCVTCMPNALPDCQEALQALEASN